ncbi:9532_t:CDS:2 [Acaulospora morrowiae]|uniref:9532_t:CDS:1 n=1 Tax=Acaulospora morrowiae TaxID=94023 RepID=A0A9N9CFV3_9GLOM|nr:9532_t:CDS:2 [Acaulospora morrowiae]
MSNPNKQQSYEIYPALITYLKGRESNFWSYMEFLTLNRTIIIDLPPFTNNWTELNDTWFKRFVQASEELGPVSIAVVEEKVLPESGLWEVFLVLTICDMIYFVLDVRLYWENVIDERNKAKKNVDEEIQDEFKPPSKRLKKDEPEKIPEPTEVWLTFLFLAYFKTLYFESCVRTKWLLSSLTEADLMELEEVSDESSLKPLKIFSTGSFIDLRKGGGYYLDKTLFISKIEDLNVCAILSLRPRRFGKTLFLSTLSSYYDIKNREKFNQIFGDLYIGKKPTSLATSFLILEIDFSGLRTNETYDIFNANFHATLNIHMSWFMDRYKQELGPYSQVIDENGDALANFLRLLKAVQSSGHKLYVFIDEYDASMNEALGNETILQDLTNHHNESVFIKSKIRLIESSIGQFYSRLKTACDKGIARVFQTGVTPVVLTEITSGFNISADLALKEEFWDLYGFKKSDVELLLDNAFGNGFPFDVKEEIMKWLKEELGGYFFNPVQPEGIFNTTWTLYCIQMFIGRMKYIDYSDDTSIIMKKLIHFPSNPHTQPLNLIINNPLGKSILTEALNGRPLESENGIKQGFRLTNIRELATDRTSLLSFLFYTGDLTYQPNLLQHNFQIPNRVSRREFIAEALKIYDWKKEDLIPVRECLQILEGENNIEPLCRFVEQALLKPLKDNSVKHSNEDALKQAFLDTLILTLHADIEPEFRVYSQSSNLSGKAIDLVKTSTRRRIAIEFDNIGMKYIKLDGARGSWQEATQVSRSLVSKSEDEILSLEISDPYRPNQKTVHEALELKIKEKSNEYLEQLKKRNDAELRFISNELDIPSTGDISQSSACPELPELEHCSTRSKSPTEPEFPATSLLQDRYIIDNDSVRF